MKMRMIDDGCVYATWLHTQPSSPGFYTLAAWSPQDPAYYADNRDQFLFSSRRVER